VKKWHNFEHSLDLDEIDVDHDAGKVFQVM
jgi:hypothetical protein